MLSLQIIVYNTKRPLIFVQVKRDLLQMNIMVFPGQTSNNITHHLKSLSSPVCFTRLYNCFFFLINLSVSSDNQFVCFLLCRTTLGIHWSATLNNISLNFIQDSSTLLLKKQQPHGILLRIVLNKVKSAFLKL